jgi:hypothetical protein
MCCAVVASLLQSHDLVAANSMLRNETAELRRQLSIANKTGKLQRLPQQL